MPPYWFIGHGGHLTLMRFGDVVSYFFPQTKKPPGRGGAPGGLLCHVLLDLRDYFAA